MVHELSHDLVAGGLVRLGVLQRGVPGRVDRFGGDDAVGPAVGQEPAEGELLNPRATRTTGGEPATRAARRVLRL
ncbi:hypothetical protein GCM10023107_92670 [Actinoplanes octamycinicus]|nr:hypothetical protein Aoc01nite_40010 [Actinoplanes octamycinicus]